MSPSKLLTCMSPNNKIHPDHSDQIEWSVAKDIYVKKMDGTKISLESIFAGKKTVIVFMRRFDCPTCYTYTMLFHHLRPILDKANMRVAFISCSLNLTEIHTFIRSFAFWLRKVSIDGIRPLPADLYFDETRQSYRFFGIGNTLGRLDYIQLWASLTLERRLNLFQTSGPEGKKKKKMSEHHAFLELMNYVRLRMPVFIPHQGNHSSSVFWQAPGIVVVHENKLLYRYILKEQYKSIPESPQLFLKNALGIETDEFDNFSFKDEMVGFVDAITNKAETAIVGSNELVLGEEIGRGVDSSVYKSVWLGTSVAVKYFKIQPRKIRTKQESLPDGAAEIQSFSNEVALMMGLKHENILMIMGFGVLPPRQFIVMEFMDRGSLFNILDSDQVLTTERKKKMLIDAASGMNYMHQRNPAVIHRDLKSLNLLVAEDWTVKIADFGISKEIKKPALGEVAVEETNSGTIQWFPPEGFLDGAEPSKKNDVYAFGIIMWEIATRRKPWSGLSHQKVMYNVSEGKRPEILETDNWTRDYRALVELAWNQQSRKRPEFTVILNKLKKVVVP